MMSIGDSDIVVDEIGNPISEPKQGQVGFSDGVECTFFIGFGWLTQNELTKLRLSEPRIAP